MCCCIVCVSVVLSVVIATGLAWWGLVKHWKHDSEYCQTCYQNCQAWLCYKFVTNSVSEHETERFFRPRWGHWNQDVSHCTETCGEGKRFRTRDCIFWDEEKLQFR